MKLPPAPPEEGTSREKNCKKIRSKKRYFFCIRPLEKNSFLSSKNAILWRDFFRRFMLAHVDQRPEIRGQTIGRRQKPKKQKPKAECKGTAHNWGPCGQLPGLKTWDAHYELATRQQGMFGVMVVLESMTWMNVLMPRCLLSLVISLEISPTYRWEI